jgi:hypothetical protein
MVHITQGNAATILLTPQQASAIAGTGVKALANAVPIWANSDEANSDTLVRQTDAVNFTTSAATADKRVIFEVNPDYLDVANGFDCIRVQTGASNAANITEASYILAGLRYHESTPLSAIVD